MSDGLPTVFTEERTVRTLKRLRFIMKHESMTVAETIIRPVSACPDAKGARSVRRKVVVVVVVVVVVAPFSSGARSASASLSLLEAASHDEHQDRSQM